MENLSIRFWAEDDRPREKMMLKGRNVLSNAELLAIIIGSGTKKKSAVEVAQEILATNNNKLRILSRRNLNELCKFDGIGEAKGISIMAAMELARRRDNEHTGDDFFVRCSNDTYKLMSSKLADLYHEEFHVVFLNNKNKVLGSELVSSGGMTNTIVDQRVVFQKAIEAKATAIVAVHNHPSGNSKPSDADNKLTQKLVDCGRILGIPLLDHVIIADQRYYSYADEGDMI
jgi:DNA repair protein RadC